MEDKIEQSFFWESVGHDYHVYKEQINASKLAAQAQNVWIWEENLFYFGTDMGWDHLFRSPL